MATLIPCLALLRGTFNDLYPNRDRSSDGWIGDLAHQQRHSDHNVDDRGLVHAIDIDSDLGDGGDLQAYCDFLIARCRSGAERRLTYVIYRRQIAHPASEWLWAPYVGTSDPHTSHAHFSGSYSPARETDLHSWHLEEVPMPLTQTDKDWLTRTIAQQVDLRLNDFFQRIGQPAPNQSSVTSRIGRDALDQGIPNPLRGDGRGKSPAWQVISDIAARLVPPPPADAG